MTLAAVNDSLSKTTILIAMRGHENKLGDPTSEVSISIPKSPIMVPRAVTLADLTKISKA